MSELDAAIVGAGHNALVAAAYLARAGRRVAVFERSARPGGAVQTRDDLLRGCRIDVGSSAHILIHLTPILQELELERYGLAYADCDPWAFYPLEDGRSLLFWKDVERTCQSIAAVSPRDAEAYRRFVEEWRPISRAVLKAFLGPPSPGRIAWTMATGGGFGGSGGMAKLQTILGPYRALLDATFEHPAVRAAVEWIAAQSGPPPSELGAAPLAGWQPLYHESGVKRAIGGSGALTDALVACIRDHGGEVHTASPVRRIVVEGGKAVGIEVAEGAEPGLPLDAPLPVHGGRTRTVRARSVLAGCHVATTFGRLLADAPEAAEMRARVAGLRVGNGFGMILRCVTRELPAYAGWEGDPRRGGDGRPGPMHQGLQLLCPPAPYLDEAYADFLRGEPARDPAVVAMSWTAVDPSLAPPGKHLLFLWAQYHPYRLAGGKSWDDEGVRQRAVDDILRATGRFAPNVPGCVEQVYVQTPLDLEREHGLYNGNVMHLEMGLDQMFFFRPTPELSGYRTPIPGLFLTGASTHPGGGVFGASGRSAAMVVMKAVR